MTYLETINDCMLKLVKQHENQKGLHSITKEARKFESELNFDKTNVEEQQATVQAKRVKKQAKAAGQKHLQEKWEQKSLHGQYVLRSKDADVDQKLTHQWLRSAGLRSETEGFLLAAQDQSLPTRNYQANILKNGADSKCRFCDQYSETIDHLVSGCPVLAPTGCMARHDHDGQYLHWKICQAYNFDTPENWYEHKTP